MPQLPDTYRAVVLEQQQQLQRLINANGVGPVRRLYQQMLDDVTKKLGAAKRDTFTHVQLRGMLAQIKLGLAGVLREMSTTVGDAAFQVGLASARGMLEDVARLEKQFTGVLVPLPLLESARLHGLVKDQTSSLLRIHDTSMNNYGVHLVGQFEKQLAASLAAGEGSTEAIDRIQRVGDLEWYRAERIVRTELSFSSAASARAAIDEQAAELDGDLWTRWSEHVSDSGAPLDDRVGVDSEAMHGQVAPPGGVFTQPPIAPGGDEVSDSLALKTWSHPPNRPNDRAVLTPWRFHWGVPGWVWRGRRVPVTAAMVQKSNSLYERKKTPVQELRSAKDPNREAASSARASVLHTTPQAPADMPQQAPAPMVLSDAYRSAFGSLPADLQHQIHALPIDHQVQIGKHVDGGMHIKDVLPDYGIQVEQVAAAPVEAVTLPTPEPIAPVVPAKPKKSEFFGPIAPEMFGPKKPKGFKKVKPVKPVIGKALSRDSFIRRRTAFADKIPEAHKSASLTYSGSSYRPINSALREGKMPDEEHLVSAIKNLDEMFASDHCVMTDSVIAHRGVRGETMKRIFGSLRAGDEFSDKGYTSTAAVSGAEFGGDIKFNITIPKGSRAAPIPSHHGTEYEYLLPRGTRFKVTKVERDTYMDETTIHCEIVGY